MQNTTQRKQAEEALRESEERFRIALSGSRITVFTQDRELRYTWIYSPHPSLSPEIVLGKTDADLVPPEDAAALTEIKRRVLQQGVGTKATVRFSAGGRPSFHDLTIEPLRDDAGKVVGLTGASTDVTDRKNVEETLQRESVLRNTLLDNLPCIALILKKGTREIVASNKAARELGAVPGKTCYETCANRDDNCPFCLAPEVWETDQPRQLEVEYEGTYYEGIWVPFTEDLYVHYLFDISDRKRAEEALRVSNQRLSSIIESAPIVVWAVDNKGLFTLSEGRGLDALGLRANEVVGQSVFDLYRDDAQALSAIKRCLDGKEFALDTELGGRVWQVQFTPQRNQKGELTGAGGVSTDVTDRKRAEQERETLIAALEAQNAELERFAYTVSHDLKSPLITINGYVGLLKEDLAKGNNQQVQNDLKRISDATDKMYVLLDEVLELSRIGRLVNPPQEVSFGHLAAEAVKLVAGQIEQAGVQVTIAPHLPVLYGDQPRLLEVLQNLVENAVKYMGDQPKPRIEIGARRENDEDVCYVRDNGVGIETRYHHKVFGLFDKLQPDSEGSGVGLALAKRIVEVHGGRIWIESEGPGRGSTFCFSIPPKTKAVAFPTNVSRNPAR